LAGSSGGDQVGWIRSARLGPIHPSEMGRMQADRMRWTAFARQGPAKLAGRRLTRSHQPVAPQLRPTESSGHSRPNWIEPSPANPVQLGSLDAFDLVVAIASDGVRVTTLDAVHPTRSDQVELTGLDWIGPARLDWMGQTHWTGLGWTGLGQPSRPNPVQPGWPNPIQLGWPNPVQSSWAKPVQPSWLHKINLVDSTELAPLDWIEWGGPSCLNWSSTACPRGVLPTELAPQD
jgi:hypothetical protein